MVAEMDMDLWKPSWSPDGEFLAFNSFDIWLVPVRGGPSPAVDDHGRTDSQPVVGVVTPRARDRLLIDRVGRKSAVACVGERW